MCICRAYGCDEHDQDFIPQDLNNSCQLLDGFKKTVKTVSDTMVLRLVTWKLKSQ